MTATSAQFNEAAAGQTVLHVHMHIIPNNLGLTLKGHGRAELVEVSGVAEHAARIKHALNAAALELAP